MRNALVTLLLLSPLLASIPACERGQPSAAADTTDATDTTDTGPVVVATLSPIAALLQQAAGDAAHVRTLLPPGAHPHSYETTPHTARTLATADLLVRVGGAADAWVASAGDVPELVLTDGIALEGQDRAGTGTSAGTGNPHVWLDPIMVRDLLLPRMSAALIDVAPDAADAIRRRTADLADSLTALDAEIRAMLDDVGGRRFVAAHPAWTYFARRYDLLQVGAVHGSPGSELGARRLARLVDETRTFDVRAVIAEPQLGRAGVDALADELDVAVEVADAVGGAGLEDREGYFELMRYNARAFARALGGG